MRFVLIHGAYHGAWCWDPLKIELQVRGHDVVAPDLPCEDPGAGAERYAEVALEAAAGSDEPAVIVAHSLGGLTAPLVAGQMPTRLIVFLAALLPVPGMSFDDQNAAIDSLYVPSETPIDNGDGSASWPRRGAEEVFYHDCAVDTAEWASARLRRQYWRVVQEATPLKSWPDVRSAVIVCNRDRVLSTTYCRGQGSHLGVTPLEVDSGHSPFLSQPAALASLLGRLGQDHA